MIATIGLFGDSEETVRLGLIIGSVLYRGISRRDGWFLWSRQGHLTLLIVALLSLLNVVWNPDHGLATRGHTASFDHSGGERFSGDALLEFVGAQFGVFSPLLFCALIWGLIKLRGRLQSRTNNYHTALLSYARPHQPPLVTWNRHEVARSHYGLTAPLKPSLGATVRFTTTHGKAEAAATLSRFQEHPLLETIKIPIRGFRTALTRLCLLAGLSRRLR